jgi:hypothetical protein
MRARSLIHTENVTVSWFYSHRCMKMFRRSPVRVQDRGGPHLCIVS